MSIGMLMSLWRGWGWIFGYLVFQYDSHCLYSVLHQQNLLSPVLNVRWVSTDAKDRWVHQLHSVCSIQLYYKLKGFCLVGKDWAMLSLSPLGDGEAYFLRAPVWQAVLELCWELLFSFFLDRLHWHSAVFGDGYFLFFCFLWDMPLLMDFNFICS